MKNIEITSDCLVKGQDTKKGTILKDVDNSTAAELLVSGRAKIAEAPKKEKPAVKKSAKKASKKVAKKDAKPDSDES